MAMSPQMIGGIINGAGYTVQSIGSVLGGIFGSSAARKHAERIRLAGDEAEKSILKGIDVANKKQEQMLDRSTGYLSPFRDAGVQATNTLTDLLFGGGDVSDVLKASPLFNFQSELGSRNINRELAARGMYGSGAGLETLARFNNQLVGEEGERLFSRIFGLSQQGQSAATNMAGITATTGNALADRIFGGRQAAAQIKYDSRLGASTQQFKGAIMQTQGMQDAFTLNGQGIREFGQSMMGGGGGMGASPSNMFSMAGGSGMGSGAAANSWLGGGPFMGGMAGFK